MTALDVAREEMNQSAVDLLEDFNRTFHRLPPPPPPPRSPLPGSALDTPNERRCPSHADSRDPSPLTPPSGVSWAVVSYQRLRSVYRTGCGPERRHATHAVAAGSTHHIPGPSPSPADRSPSCYCCCCVAGRTLSEDEAYHSVVPADGSRPLIDVASSHGDPPPLCVNEMPS